MDIFSCLNNGTNASNILNFEKITQSTSNANSETSKPHCGKKIEMRRHTRSHTFTICCLFIRQFKYYYIQISPDFPRITQKAKKQVNTNVPSVVDFEVVL